MVTTSKVGGFVFALFGPLGEAGDPPEGDDKPTFDEKQQEQVNKIVQNRVAQERKVQLEKYDKLKSDYDAMKSQIEELQKKAPKGKAKEGEEEDISALRSKLDELTQVVNSTKQEAELYKKQAQLKEKDVEAANTRERQLRKKVAIGEAASKINFFDLEDVRAMTDRHVQWNDEHGRFVVVREDGQLRLNSSLEPMSLDEFYTEFAQKKPFMVRSDVKSGTGSTQSAGKMGAGLPKVDEIFGPKSDGAKALALKKASPDAYKRLRAEAIELNLIAG